MIRNALTGRLLLLLMLLWASCAFLHDDRSEYKADIDSIVTDEDIDVSSQSKAYDIYVRSLLLYNEGVS
jgi:hypothetical protein